MYPLINIVTNLSLFPHAQAAIEKAALEIFSSQFRNADLANLRGIRDALGPEATIGLIRKQKGTDVAKVLKAVDPHGPASGKSTPAKVLERILALVGGEAEIAKPYDLGTMDLQALRGAAADMGPSFDGWLAEQKPPKAKQAAIRLDNNRPGLAKGAAKEHLEAIKRLASGAEPFKAPDLSSLDVPGLRSAYQDLGQTFGPWLKSCKAPDLKAALVRLDPHRPKVDKRQKDEYPLFLTEIAKGGSVYHPEGSEPGIGDRAFPMGGRQAD